MSFPEAGDIHVNNHVFGIRLTSQTVKNNSLTDQFQAPGASTQPSCLCSKGLKNDRRIKSNNFRGQSPFSAKNNFSTCPGCFWASRPALEPLCSRRSQCCEQMPVMSCRFATFAPHGRSNRAIIVTTDAHARKQPSCLSIWRIHTLRISPSPAAEPTTFVFSRFHDCSGLFPILGSHPCPCWALVGLFVRHEHHQLTLGLTLCGISFVF